jgi:hypothetical protein
VHAASAVARAIDLLPGFDPSPWNPKTVLLRLADVVAARKT